MRLPHSFIPSLLAIPQLVVGATNTTFDDSDSSFTFTGSWNTITPSSPCSFCASSPDPSQARNGTWHDGNTRNPASGSFTFIGSGVYIFGIDQATLEPNIVFTLDNIEHVHRYTGSELYICNALFFSADGLASDQTHTVNWVLNFVDTAGVDVQAALFDYAVVTSGNPEIPRSAVSTTSIQFASNVTQLNLASLVNLQERPRRPLTVPATPPSTISDPRSLSKPHTGAIAGGIVGALLVSILVVLASWFYCRGRHHLESATAKAAVLQPLRLEDYPHRFTPDIPKAGDSHQRKPEHTPGSRLRHRNSPSGAENGGPFGTSPLQENHIYVPDDSEFPASALIAPPSAPTHPPNGGDLHFLEQRLATLEAQVALGQQPPPYVTGEDD
ncbi:hypothetical protein R3P38DRAFT_3474262 [Favolaschia claudopus]|uniref:Uncharacterized protein n=1 Tax=Favolaschia claudopus TaxID=2862362 RepID=A0AAW0CHY5_9AGAR